MIIILPLSDYSPIFLCFSHVSLPSRPLSLSVSHSLAVLPSLLSLLPSQRCTVEPGRELVSQAAKSDAKQKRLRILGFRFRV